MTEIQLQSKCYQWAFNNYPQLRYLLFSVPNGGTRHMAEASQLKASGLTPGIPDMIIMAPQVMGIEFKTLTGTLSPAQIKVHAVWRANGIRVEVVRTFEQWQQIIFALITQTP